MSLTRRVDPDAISRSKARQAARAASRDYEHELLSSHERLPWCARRLLSLHLHDCVVTQCSRPEEGTLSLTIDSSSGWVASQGEVGLRFSGVRRAVFDRVLWSSQRSGRGDRALTERRTPEGQDLGSWIYSELHWDEDGFFLEVMLSKGELRLWAKEVQLSWRSPEGQARLDEERLLDEHRCARATRPPGVRVVLRASTYDPALAWVVAPLGACPVAVRYCPYCGEALAVDEASP